MISFFEKANKSSHDFHYFFPLFISLFFSYEKLSLLSLFDIFFDLKNCISSSFNTLKVLFLLCLKLIIENLLQSRNSELQFFILFSLFINQFKLQFLHEILMLFVSCDRLGFEETLSFLLGFYLLFSFFDNVKNFILKPLR